MVKKRETRAKTLEKDYDIAYDFAVKAYTKFQDVVKSKILILILL
jgi:hypothetical protein